MTAERAIVGYNSGSNETIATVNRPSVAIWENNKVLLHNAMFEIRSKYVPRCYRKRSHPHFHECKMSVALEVLLTVFIIIVLSLFIFLLFGWFLFVCLFSEITRNHIRAFENACC